MSGFETIRLAEATAEAAPDGSRIRVLPRVARGSMIHVELGAGRVSRAVAHRTVVEIWYVLSGRGKLWRRHKGTQETVALSPGVSLTVPRRTHFQFRASPHAPLSILAVTMPKWPGEDEAYGVKGPWAPTKT